jgi:hypothetical protein
VQRKLTILFLWPELKVKFGVVLSLAKAMRRRDFIKAIAGSAAAWPLAARQQTDARLTIGGRTL